jgi:hypothetical protein
MLAEKCRFCDNITMDTSTRVEKSEFERDASEVLTNFKMAVSSVLAAVGVRRPVELQQTLKLQSTLSWQLFKVANERSVFSTGGSVPSRASVLRFANAATEVGVSAETVRSLMTAYGGFEQLVERHAGDRTSFNSLVSAVTGRDDDWLAADLQHRRNMYRGFSAVLGVQVQTTLTCSIVQGRPGTKACDVAFLSGLVDLRMLRPRDTFRVFGFTLGKRKDTPELRSMHISADPDSYCLDPFCSQPLPPIKTTLGRRGRRQWVESSLIRPQLGKQGATTVMFGGTSHLADCPAAFNAVVNVPAETLILDVLISPSARQDAVLDARMLLGSNNASERAPSPTTLQGDHRLESLGRGVAGLATADVPGYVDMVRTVADKLGCDTQQLEAWRLRVSFPVHQSIARIRLLAGKEKQPRRRSRLD